MNIKDLAQKIKVEKMENVYDSDETYCAEAEELIKAAVNQKRSAFGNYKSASLDLGEHSNSSGVIFVPNESEEIINISSDQGRSVYRML